MSSVDSNTSLVVPAYGDTIAAGRWPVQIQLVNKMVSSSLLKFLLTQDVEKATLSSIWSSDNGYMDATAKPLPPSSVIKVFSNLLLEPYYLIPHCMHSPVVG